MEFLPRNCGLSLDLCTILNKDNYTIIDKLYILAKKVNPSKYKNVDQQTFIKQQIIKLNENIPYYHNNGELLTSYWKEMTKVFNTKDANEEDVSEDLDTNELILCLKNKTALLSNYLNIDMVTCFMDNYLSCSLDNWKKMHELDKKIKTYNDRIYKQIEYLHFKSMLLSHCTFICSAIMLGDNLLLQHFYVEETYNRCMADESLIKYKNSDEIYAYSDRLKTLYNNNVCYNGWNNFELEKLAYLGFTVSDIYNIKCCRCNNIVVNIFTKPANKVLLEHNEMYPECLV